MMRRRQWAAPTSCQTQMLMRSGDVRPTSLCYLPVLQAKPQQDASSRRQLPAASPVSALAQTPNTAREGHLIKSSFCDWQLVTALPQTSNNSTGGQAKLV